MLLVTPLVQELKKDFPQAKIDVFAKGKLVDVVFENYDNYGTSIKLSRKPAKELLEYLKSWTKILAGKYDLVINVDAASKSGKLATKYTKSKHKIFGVDELAKISQYSDYRHLAKYPVYAYWSHFNIPVREISPIRLKFSAEERVKGQQIYASLQGSQKPLICLFTYATNQKIYDSSWWDPFYEALAERFSSEYEIIEVLPVENISQFDHKIKHYYSKDVREIASVLENAALFIGADSGMMHLAVSSGVPTIGLFKITKPEKYEPYGGNSGFIDTTKTSLPEMIRQIESVLSSKK
ncbi:glycosyltransferase family 9 protein [Flavobacterium sp.]|uniref:glycosyltransferase family 9 protein n=1 Tax=Flavobacterium sp. TaxID=239 RepID=UPI00261CD0C6|nr:glycosyltransferase family 9 protein [Flavobacterium sp.]